MLVIGLTGAIASGKTTTAGLFAAEGVPVFSADAAVHRLYSGPAAAAVELAFPGVVVDGEVDRSRLSASVHGRPAELARLEAIIHPLVRAEEEAFPARSRQAGHRFVILDIPLLFETGGESRVDATVVTTAPEEVRLARALARPGMTEDRYRLLAERQLSDTQKRARADYVVDTGMPLAMVRKAVRAILDDLQSG